MSLWEMAFDAEHEYRRDEIRKAWSGRDHRAQERPVRGARPGPDEGSRDGDEASGKHADSGRRRGLFG